MRMGETRSFIEAPSCSEHDCIWCFMRMGIHKVRVSADKAHCMMTLRIYVWRGSHWDPWTWSFLHHDIFGAWNTTINHILTLYSHWQLFSSRPCNKIKAWLIVTKIITHIFCLSYQCLIAYSIHTQYVSIRRANIVDRTDSLFYFQFLCGIYPLSMIMVSLWYIHGYLFCIFLLRTDVYLHSDMYISYLCKQKTKRPTWDIPDFPRGKKPVID